MYTPPHFQERRPAVIAEAIRSIRLATLITATQDDYQASPVPMVLKQDGDVFALETHVARPNPHWTVLDVPRPSIAVFQGPHAYVSPSFYPSKREHGRVVPTWNYIAVHAHGLLERVDDAAWLAAHLQDLTVENEADRAHPWHITDAPAAFIGTLSRTIVGLRFRVGRFEASWKMAQHKGEADRGGVMAGLSASTSDADRAVGAVMSTLEQRRSTSALNREGSEKRR